MIRLTLALIAATVLSASLAAAEAPDTPRPAFDLTGAEADSAERACFGPTGRLVPCRRGAPLR